MRLANRPLVMLISFAMLTLASIVAAETTVRVIDLNIGSGTHSLQSGTCKWCNAECEWESDEEYWKLKNNIAIVGLRRLFGREAVEGLKIAERVVIGMQEVDVHTSRNPDWNMPEYFRDRLNIYTGQDWYEAFLPAMNLEVGQYGIALFANTPFLKKVERPYAWDSSNKSDWGCEPHVALAGKIVVDDDHVLWIVNTHLAAKGKNCSISDADAVDAATRQIWQVLGVMGRMDPDHPILLLGDFNIRQGGDHKTLGLSAEHRDSYEAMSTILHRAGFEQLGYVGEDDSGQPAPCWNIGTCTFKPWNDYSKLDYLFLRDPHNKIQASEVTLIQPVVDEGCILTDHKGLRVDLVFTD